MELLAGLNEEDLVVQAAGLPADGDAVAPVDDLYRLSVFQLPDEVGQPVPLDLGDKAGPGVPVGVGDAEAVLQLVEIVQDQVPGGVEIGDENVLFLAFFVVRGVGLGGADRDGAALREDQAAAVEAVVPALGVDGLQVVGPDGENLLGLVQQISAADAAVGLLHGAEALMVNEAAFPEGGKEAFQGEFFQDFVGNGHDGTSLLGIKGLQ